jgi:hypothetical protein
MSTGRSDDERVDIGSWTEWTNDGPGGCCWYRPGTDGEAHQGDAVVIKIGIVDITIESSGYSPTETILAVQAAADSLRTLSRRPAKPKEQGPAAGPGTSPALNLEQGWPPIADDPELETQSIVIRRAPAGVDIDITGMSLDEAASASAAGYRWVRKDQPRVQVISHGKVVGRYRKRMNR